MLDGVRGAIAKINLRKMDDEEGRVCVIGIAKQRSLSQGDLNQTKVPPPPPPKSIIYYYR